MILIMKKKKINMKNVMINVQNVMEKEIVHLIIVLHVLKDSI